MKKVALAIHAVKNFNVEILNTLDNLDYIHVDVMDGKFVNNTMLYLEIFQKIKQVSDLPIIAHLMVENPEQYISKIEKYVDIFLIHYEIPQNPEKIIDSIKKNNKKVGIVLNPETSLDQLNSVINKIDIVLLMGVHPGWSGQEFIPNTIKRVKTLAELKKKYRFEIDVDGGVNLENAKNLVGADILSSSSTILKAEDPNQVIKELKDINYHE